LFSKEWVAGDEALAKRFLCILNPVERGFVVNWEDVEKIFRYTFDDKLRVASKDRPLLLAETPLTPRSDREQMTEVVFEHLQSPSLFIEVQSALSLFATGRTTGVVLESGDTTTHAVPVVDGRTLTHAVNRFEMAGSDIAAYLTLILAERGFTAFTAEERKIAVNIKQTVCRVALDFDAEAQTAASASPAAYDVVYQLPDGQQLAIGKERFQAPEGLFRPWLYSMEHYSKPQSHSFGVHESLINSISKCDAAFQSDLYANVLLSGGNTMFPGFEARLEKELTALAPASTKINVIAPAERQWLTWLGGSILAALPTFAGRCITKAEYDEHGKAIIHRKCPR